MRALSPCDGPPAMVPGRCYRQPERSARMLRLPKRRCLARLDPSDHFPIMAMNSEKGLHGDLLD